MRRRIVFDPDLALPWVCVAAAFAWFAGLALCRPAADGDLLWQRWLGTTIIHNGAIPRQLGAETFTASGAPWTPQEWLFSLALAVTSAHHLEWLVPLACALAATLAVATVVLRCRRRAVSPILAAGGAIVCVLATIQSYGVRAQVLGWAGLATTLWLLEREDAWSYAVIPITAIWANLHASVFLAPTVATLAAAAIALRDRCWSPALRRALAIAAGSALATLATPLGLALPRYALMLLGSPIRASISEWGATSAGNAAFVIGALPLILVLALFGTRTALRDRFLVAAFVVALFGAVRNIPIFAIAVAPIALAALPSRPRVPMRVASRAAFAGACLAGALFGALPWRLEPAADELLPLRPARALLANQSNARVFCEDFAWCSLFLGTPSVRVFLDGRCDPYPASVWRDYRLVLDGDPRWSSVLASHHVDAVLVRRDSALDALLASRGRWRAVSADRQARLYVRDAIVARP
jgi:hypothetical protein